MVYVFLVAFEASDAPALSSGSTISGSYVPFVYRYTAPQD
jgi:hypothetical protein